MSELAQAWLELMDEAVEEKDVPQILHNREAQHKYLTWRAEKVLLIAASTLKPIIIL